MLRQCLSSVCSQSVCVCVMAEGVHVCVAVLTRLLRAVMGKRRGQDGGISSAMLSTGCCASVCVRAHAWERNRDTCLDVQAKARGFQMR